jgi:formylmethanofuran dehydrogenase subunit C
MAMTFRWKRDQPPAGTCDASGLTPDRFPGATASELGAQTLTVGNRDYRWDELFTLEGDPSSLWQLPGNVNYLYLAQGLKQGSLQVAGHAGDFAGMQMQGGTLVVKGDAGHRLGAGMAGGLIRLHGNAGSELGGPAPGSFTGMTDGEILVDGTTGPRAGFRVRRGLIAVAQTGEYAGYEMQAGTLVVVQGPLHHPGMQMKRGTIVLLESSPVAGCQSHLSAECVTEPVILRLIMKRLTQLGYPVPFDLPKATYRLYSGDHLLTGQGELFVHEGK